MPRGWLFLRRISRLGWGAIIAAIVLGVLANFVYAALPQVWQHLVNLMSMSLLLWIITFVALLCCAVVFFLWKQDTRSWNMRLADLSCKLDEKKLLFVLDDSLMRLLPSMITTTKSDALDLDKRMHKLIDKLLDVTAKAFPQDVRRGILFRPDADRKHLIVWDLYGWVNREMKGQAIFDISGKADTRPGVAGNVFLKGETVIAHIVKKGGQYTWDQSSYISFEKQNDPPPHSSLICVPITGLIPGSSIDADGKLGVVCLDSKNLTLFDPPEIQEKLALLSRHIAAALLIHDQLSQACSASSCIFARGKPSAA